MKSDLALRLGLVFATLAFVGSGQEAPTEEKPPADKPPVRQIGGLKFVDVAEVTIVNVDVSVRDKNGPVSGLKLEDFVVSQDGKLQPLTNFAVYTEKSEAPAAAATALPAAAPTAPAPVATATPAAAVAPLKREPAFIAIYVDNENILPMNRNRVIGRMTEWVRDHLTPPDVAMVISYQRSMKILQPFTSDADEVAAALNTMKRYTGGRTDAVNSRKQVEDYIDQNADQNPTSIISAMDQATSFAREQRNNLQFTIGALQELIGMMTGLPGKKAIVYLSDGLAMTPGLELFYEIEDRYRSPSTLSAAHENDATDLFQRLVTSATAAGVTFYTIDARGLESESGIEAENRTSRSSLAANIAQTNYQDSLTYMADQTGGLAVLNSNDPTPGLNRISADLDTYYSLGYRLTPSGQDRTHRIDVKVKGHPEYKLNYRRTFIEKTLPTRIADRVVSGLEFDLQDNPLGIELKAGDPSPAANDRWTLPVEVHVALDKIALIPDEEQVERPELLSPALPAPLVVRQELGGGVRIFLPASERKPDTEVRLEDVQSGEVLLDAKADTAPGDLQVPYDKWPADPYRKLRLFRGRYFEKEPILKGILMIYYAARDNEGKQSDLQRIEQIVRVPTGDYERARHQYYTVTTSLLLEPGRYRISVGVRDELTNQAGYAATKQAVHPEVEK